MYKRDIVLEEAVNLTGDVGHSVGDADDGDEYESSKIYLFKFYYSLWHTIEKGKITRSQGMKCKRVKDPILKQITTDNKKIIILIIIVITKS